jgi:hypothetical protein
MIRRPAATIAVLAFLAVRSAVAQVAIVDPGQGRVSLSSGTTGAAELSGLAWVGGSTYHAVGDNGATAIWTLSATTDASTGWITGAAVVAAIPAAALGSDSEGIAFRPTAHSVFITDEVASTISEFSLATGGLVQSVPVPVIYAAVNVQSNMGLEAVASRGTTLWTANEEAVVPDGPLSTASAGSWVRIQRFDGSFAAAGQWAYRTDPISAESPFYAGERSGVVDIQPWSDTGLLVLEREFGGVLPGFRSRIYQVDVTMASDVSGLATVASGGFTPLPKTLLWEQDFATSNFEGMTFGPVLANGARSLLLVSDDGGGISQDLYPLQFVPEPGTISIAIAAMVTMLVVGRSCRVTFVSSPCRRGGLPARCPPR